jgi:hypothetical protein
LRLCHLLRLSLWYIRCTIGGCRGELKKTRNRSKPGPTGSCGISCDPRRRDCRREKRLETAHRNCGCRRPSSSYITKRRKCDNATAQINLKSVSSSHVLVAFRPPAASGPVAPRASIDRSRNTSRCAKYVGGNDVHPVGCRRCVRRAVPTLSQFRANAINGLNVRFPYGKQIFVTFCVGNACWPTARDTDDS